MTDEKIERIAEIMMDRLDDSFGPDMSQEEYDAGVAKIDAWVERQYALQTGDSDGAAWTGWLPVHFRPALNAGMQGRIPI